MKKTLTIGLSAVALTLAGAAFAQQAGGDRMMHTDMTRTQAQAKAEEMFAKLDANKDGTLTPADREARRQAMRTKAFDALDTDKNGQISRDEFMNAKHQGMRGEMGMRDRGDKRDHMGDHKGDHMRGPMGMHDRGMMGMGMGANKDTPITKTQFVANVLSHFDKVDANKDGKVTAEEHKAAREAMRAQWREKKAEKAN